MSKAIPITQFGYQILNQKKRELSRILKKPGRRTQEMAHALRAYQEQLAEIDLILENSVVTENSEKQPASVQIGSKVTIENLTSGVVMEYTVLSRATADPTRGIISNESPLAQKIMGLKVGNTFKFKSVTGAEDSFKIKSVE